MTNGVNCQARLEKGQAFAACPFHRSNHTKPPWRFERKILVKILCWSTAGYRLSQRDVWQVSRFKPAPLDPAPFENMLHQAAIFDELLHESGDRPRLILFAGCDVRDQACRGIDLDDIALFDLRRRLV